MIPTNKTVEHLTINELDVGSIKSLSDLAKALTTGGSLTVPGGLTVMGEINTVGNVYTPIIPFKGGPNQPVWTHQTADNVLNMLTPFIGQQFTFSNSTDEAKFPLMNLYGASAPRDTQVIVSAMVKLGTATNFVLHFTDTQAWQTRFNGDGKEYKNELNKNTFTEIKHKLTIPPTDNLNIHIGFGNYIARPNTIAKQSEGTVFTYGWKYYFDTTTSR